MTFIVDKIKFMLNAEIFQGIYDENGYTGKGKKLNGPDVERYSGLTGNSGNVYYKKDMYFYNFPENFVPKKNALYLCTYKLKKIEKGSKVYHRFYLKNPIELNPLYINTASPNFYSVSEIEGMCKKTGFIHKGYLSNDNVLNVTDDASPIYPIKFMYNEITDSFIYNATINPTSDRDPEPISYETEKSYPFIGDSDTTQMYKKFHTDLKSLVIETLEAQSLEISNTKVQNLINNIYKIRNLEISVIDGPHKPDKETDLNYDIIIHLSIKDENPNLPSYYDDDMKTFSVTKIFRVAESVFSNKAKKVIARYQETNTLIEKIRYQGEVYKVLYLYPSGMWEIERNGIKKELFGVSSEIEILSN